MVVEETDGGLSSYSYSHLADGEMAGTADMEQTEAALVMKCSAGLTRAL